MLQLYTVRLHFLWNTVWHKISAVTSTVLQNGHVVTDSDSFLPVDSWRFTNACTTATDSCYCWWCCSCSCSCSATATATTTTAATTMRNYVWSSSLSLSLPWHSSPVAATSYPVWQSQRKDPGVFTHAPFVQILSLDRHSSISNHKKAASNQSICRYTRSSATAGIVRASNF